ncbi:MAG TPA: type I-MYXAN CRISPR-associated protein Cas6/Cmx6 [Rhodoferax sp.]|nr:type I-MYXAN CRISPR-associated protein Cas6/Cmx6 [Rhodoferax sp.]
MLVTDADSAVEAVFPLEGKTLPREHAQALLDALVVSMPWLQDDAGAGIHPLKLVSGTESMALLSGRTRLILRVKANRLDKLRASEGAQLDVAGHPLRLGAVHLRALQPLATLYAYRVAAIAGDESAFMQAMEAELAALGVAGERVCGKRQMVRVNQHDMVTFSMMLHGLGPDQSLRLQQHGLGPHRLLGCGLFVPHKSAAAVGS